jgi:hypothetical protein
MDLFGWDLIAVDGTRIKAVDNKDRNFTPRIADPIHQTGRRRARRLPSTARPERCHRERNNRVPGQEPGREDRRDPQSAHAMQGRPNPELLLQRPRPQASVMMRTSTMALMVALMTALMVLSQSWPAVLPAGFWVEVLHINSQR